MADRSSSGTEYPTLRAANDARQKEWDTGNQITLAYRGNELAGEVGEACNVLKKLERERLGIRGSRATKEQLAEELADVVICADLIAMDAGIDLDVAVRAKFNATSEKVGLATRYGGVAQAPVAWRWRYKNFPGEMGWIVTPTEPRGDDIEVQPLYASPVSSTPQLCPGGIDPGFEECPKCGATMDDDCPHSSTD